MAANDADPWAGATFRANHKPLARPSLSVLPTRRFRSVLLTPPGTAPWTSRSGGPPCQAFSQVRNHHRIINDPRNALYRHFVEMIAALRPRPLRHGECTWTR